MLIIIKKFCVTSVGGKLWDHKVGLNMGHSQCLSTGYRPDFSNKQQPTNSLSFHIHPKKKKKNQFLYTFILKSSTNYYIIFIKLMRFFTKTLIKTSTFFFFFFIFPPQMGSSPNQCLY